MNIATLTPPLVEIPDRTHTLQRTRLLVDNGLYPESFLQNLNNEDQRNSRPFLPREHEFLQSDQLANEIIRPDPHYVDRRKYQLAHDLITLGIITMDDLLPYIQNRAFAHPIYGCHDIKRPIAGWIGYFDGAELRVRSVSTSQQFKMMRDDFRRFDHSRGPGPCKMFFFDFPEKLDRAGRTISCMITTHRL